jgi:gamma-glutamyltranspeptidase/glutathione hydrolase
MAFATKTVSGFIALVALGCDDADPEMALRAAPQALPDTTLPDDDDSSEQQPKAKKPGTGKAFYEGVATASEPIVAQAAAAVLARENANAIDAAVTAMFMANVAEPQSSGIGGGGFAVIHLAESNETFTLNCREKAPIDTPRTIFTPPTDFLVRSTSGYAVGVPGTVACAAKMLEDWGTISLAEALAPAIEAAKEGIFVSSRLAADTNSPRLQNELEPADNPYAVARAVFRPDGAPLAPGELLVQPDLAHTFELIAAHGPDAFYRCDHEAGIAQAIVNTQYATRSANLPDPDDPDKKIGVGRMMCTDLESYEVEVLAPVSGSYRGYQLFSMGPPSSGGIAVLQILGMLEGFPIGDDDEGYGFGELATVNVTLEAMRLAFADRAVWVGDDDCPDCSYVPVTGLLSDAYLDERRELIVLGDRIENNAIAAGDPWPYDSNFGDSNLLAGPPDSSESGDTTHISIIDAEGNIVSLTFSVEAMWGTGLMVPECGFLLNNQLTDFNAVANANDPVGVNDPAPEKQPRSSIAPTIVFLDGEPVAAYGSPGGATIINTVVNMTLNLIDHRMTLLQSVAAPRFSIASPTSVVTYENGSFADGVIVALQALGYSFSLVPPAGPPIGAVQAIISIPGTGRQYGAADARRLGGVFAADKL